MSRARCATCASSTGGAAGRAIGTGTSDLLESLGGGFRVGLDFKIEHLLGGDGDGIRRVAGDALHLPFRDDAVDVVTSSHFFHHFSPEENAAILRESLRVARRGVMMTDTRRHWAQIGRAHV